MSNEDDYVGAVARLSTANVLVAGDVMLDRYIFGHIDRISPEAPVPVLNLSNEDARLGGSGNVLSNLVALGARGRLVSVLGDDDGAAEVLDLLGAADSPADGVIADSGRHTTVKQRFFAGGQQVLRVDRETVEPVSDRSKERILRAFGSFCDACDIVVLSDYKKGLLTPDVAQELLLAAKRKGLRVVVDPKGRDYSAYRGAYLVTPNLRELQQATGMAVDTDAGVVAACRTLIDSFDFDGVLATRSEFGMTLVMREASEIHLKAESTEVFDVTGAGDSVVAVLAAGLASGLPPERAAFLANVAAGIVVRKLGAASVRPAEIIRELSRHSGMQPIAKLVRKEELATKLEQCRAMNLRIGFTNGCFDLLHPGHLAVLRQARESCDHLVVGLNSDHSVMRLKGPGRPVQGEMARAAVMASLNVVDHVVVFDEDTPESLIEAIRPDVLIKGADYTQDQVVGAQFVKSYGGRVVLVDIERGHSSTSLIGKLLDGGKVLEAGVNSHRGARKLASAS